MGNRSLISGRGISLGRSFARELASQLESSSAPIRSQLDWVELIPENYVGRGGEIRRALFKIRESFPIVLHGVGLSIGSVDPLNWDYLSMVKSLIQDTGALWFSDHISYSSVNGIQFHNLLPMPFTLKAARHIAERLNQVRDYFGVPIGLENPSYYAVMPGSEMSEAEFVSEVIRLSDAWLLLDVNNVFVNCWNHCKENIAEPENVIQAAIRYFSEIPIGRVLEVHIAGHEKIDLEGQEKLLDTHGAHVNSQVQFLLEELNLLRPVPSLLLEREQNVPPFSEVIQEVNSLWNKIQN